MNGEIVGISIIVYTCKLKNHLLILILVPSSGYTSSLLPNAGNIQILYWHSPEPFIPLTSPCHLQKAAKHSQK